MRIAVLLAALFAPLPALAQTASLSEPEKAWTEVQQQAAEAESAQDCALACRALQSLARATQHLCDLGPEHCDEARAKLREATERVRAMCPGCTAAESTAAPPPPRAETAAGSSDQVVAETATRSRGGCAGCSATDSEGGLVAPALAALAFLASRRRRRPHVKDGR